MSMRISGLASGMDIDSMVKELMKARRSSLDQLFQKRTVAEWQQEAYRDISTSMVDFRNNKLASYSLSSAIEAKTTQVSGNTKALTVNSASSAAAGTLDVRVTQVATTANTIYAYDDPTIAGTGPDNPGNRTLASLGFTAGKLTFNGSVDVNYSGTDTLNDLVAKINATKAANVTALYNSATGQFSISNTLTGAGTVNVTGMSPDFTGTATAGRDAIATINGVDFTQSSNNFNVSGINFTVKAVSGVDGNTSITAVTDTNKIMDTIKSFVSEYNNLIGKLNTKMDEERYRTYLPLTDDQKSGMSDKQIELWERKAKSGLLRRDSILMKTASDLRISVTSNFAANTGIQTIGITTGAWYDKGKLVIDETKLRAAIEANPQQVVDILTKPGDDSNPANANVGIFKKASKVLMDSLKSLSEKAGTSLTSTDLNSTFLSNASMSESIRNMKTRESDLAARLVVIENNYYKQFSAMEAAINKFNSQGSAFSSFMS